MEPIDGAGGALSYIDKLKSLQEKQKVERGETGEKQTGQVELKQEDFLALLTKQLANQDPFKPVDNEKMIAQMASFATVEGIGKMNDQFGSLNAAMTSNQALQASSLVGQDVLIPGQTGFKGAHNGISGMMQLPQPIENVMMRVQSPSGELIRAFSIGSKGAGEHRFQWDGKDDRGNLLPEGNYKLFASGSVNGKPQNLELSTYANVNSVLLGSQGGEVMLNIAGYQAPVKLSEVQEIGQVNSNQTNASK